MLFTAWAWLLTWGNLPDKVKRDEYWTHSRPSYMTFKWRELFTRYVVDLTIVAVLLGFLARLIFLHTNIEPPLRTLAAILGCVFALHSIGTVIIVFLMADDDEDRHIVFRHYMKEAFPPLPECLICMTSERPEAFVSLQCYSAEDEAANANRILARHVFHHYCLWSYWESVRANSGPDIIWTPRSVRCPQCSQEPWAYYAHMPWLHHGGFLSQHVFGWKLVEYLERVYFYTAINYISLDGGTGRLWLPRRVVARPRLDQQDDWNFFLSLLYTNVLHCMWMAAGVVSLFWFLKAASRSPAVTLNAILAMLPLYVYMSILAKLIANMTVGPNGYLLGVHLQVAWARGRLLILANAHESRISRLIRFLRDTWRVFALLPGMFKQSAILYVEWEVTILTSHFVAQILIETFDGGSA